MAEADNCNITFIDIYEWYAMIIPVLIILTFLPSFKILAYAAYVGAVFLAVAMIVSLVTRVHSGGRSLGGVAGNEF